MLMCIPRPRGCQGGDVGRGVWASSLHTYTCMRLLMMQDRAEWGEDGKRKEGHVQTEEELEAGSTHFITSEQNSK